MPKPIRARTKNYRDYEEGYDLIHGVSGQWSNNPDSKPDRLVATLWVPNPEMRSGWNEWNVYAEAAEPARPRLGLRRTGETSGEVRQ